MAMYAFKVIALVVIGGLLQLFGMFCAVVVGTSVEQHHFTFGPDKLRRKHREIGMFFVLAVAFWAIGALLIGGAR